MRIKLISLLMVPFLGVYNSKPAANDNAHPSVNQVLVPGSTTYENTLHKESINLFRAYWRDSSNTVLVSLSDIYPDSGNEDSLLLPDIREIGAAASNYFILKEKHRKNFLLKTNITETDSVFLYDYAKNKTVSFAVKKLKMAAMINDYMSEKDWPYHTYDYMIGFEINKQYLKGLSNYCADVLVYVGKENPFAQEQLTPVAWKKTAAKTYPSKSMTKETMDYLKGMTIGDTYLYNKDDLQYFLQEYIDNSHEVNARRLLIVHATTKKVILENVYQRGESESPAPLNYQNKDDLIHQWTGKLLKNKPAVVFGFNYVSFGCPSILFIDKSAETLYLQCDNRH